MNESDLEEMINLDEFFSRTSVPSTDSDHAYRRLETLYEISKVLTVFESVRKSIPEILDLVAQTFPIRSIVLVENRRAEIRTLIWLGISLNEQQIKLSVSRARRTFSYMTYRSLGEAAEVQAGSFSTIQLGHRLLPKQFHFDEKQNFFAVPLVVDREHIFGILQFDGVSAPGEDDLRFANALTNLFSVAFDRSLRAEEERLRVESLAQTAAIERDQSVQVANELAAERGLRERFVQGLSHDLRTPLTAISMAAQILKRSSTITANDAKLVDRLLLNSDRLQSMIETLLDANRLKAGETLPLEIEACDMCEILNAVILDQREISGRAIEYKGPARADGFWDRSGVRRLFENLVGNAVKYSVVDSTIKVSLKRMLHGILLTVHNEGAPISSDDQKTLFNQFRRTKSAQDGGKPGWGLGLTLVKGLCEAHGGTVIVKSELGEGTRFIVNLPYDSRSTQGGEIENSDLH